MKILWVLSLRLTLGVGALMVFVLAETLCFAADPVPKGKNAFEKVGAAMRKDRDAARSEFEKKFKEMSWHLLMGDLAGDPAHHLPSETRKYLEAPLKEFNRLLADKKDMDNLAKSDALVLRLNNLRRMRERLEEKKEVAIADERKRLNQLRGLASAYRDLTAKMAEMNTFFLFGDHVAVRKLHADIKDRLKEVQKIADKREDYYLFEDEKDLNAKEVKLLTSVTPPIVTDMVGHFQSLQALMAYRLAVDSRVEKKPEQRAVELEEALGIVKDLLAGPAEKAPPLAYYVDGISRQELGLLATADKTLDKYKEAAPLFKKAQQSLDTAATHPALKTMKAERLEADLKQRQTELTSSKSFLDDADKKTLARRPAEAVKSLARGLRMHPVSALVVALAEARLRDGTDLDGTHALLGEAVKAGLLPETDRAALLLRGRVEMAHAWERLARNPDKVTSEERKKLLAQFRDARAFFTKAARDAKDEKIARSADANIALSFAYATFLDPEADLPEAQAAFGGLKDTVAGLKSLLEKGTETEQLAAREAMVAARLAQCYLTVRFQEPWREDALYAFAAANDEQARVGFGAASIKLFGSPLLSAVLSRPDMKGLKVAAEERQLREIVGQVSEGIATLKLGNAETAARQVKAALEKAEALPAEPPIDAGQLLDRKADEDRATVRARTRALAVLTLLDGKQSDAALREALKLSPVKLDEDRPERLAVTDIRLAARAVRDPLAAFALALAMEEFAVTRLEQGSKKAQDLLTEAKTAQLSTQELLKKSAPLRARYPQIEVLVGQAIERLTPETGPKSYVAKAGDLRQRMYVTEAVQKIEEGLRRHPDDGPLQEQRILLKLDEADLSPGGGQQVAQDVVNEAERASKAGILRSAGSLLALAKAHERLGQDARAIETYRRALKAGATEEERQDANVRISVLSARLNLTRPPQPQP